VRIDVCIERINSNEINDNILTERPYRKALHPLRRQFKLGACVHLDTVQTLGHKLTLKVVFYLIFSDVALNLSLIIPLTAVLVYMVCRFLYPIGAWEAWYGYPAL
jgi:hypothetical protein